MKLSEIKGDDALEVITKIIEPIAQIASDKKLQADRKAGKPKLLIIKYVLENYKPQVFEILAALNQTSVDEYKKTVSLISLPMEIMEILNDPEVMVLFNSQSQTEKTSSGSASENTEA